MKKILTFLFVMLLLTGCTGKSEMARATALRQRLTVCKGCHFQSEVTADFSEKTYTFSMDCQLDSDGNLTFTVKKPDLIGGITGTVAADGGKLTFDGRVLVFDTLSEGQLSPVSGPWHVLHTLRSGYLSACSTEEEGLHLSVDDSHAGEMLHLELWLDALDLPKRGELIWKGRRILSVDIRNFEFL